MELDNLPPIDSLDNVDSPVTTEDPNSVQVTDKAQTASIVSDSEVLPETIREESSLGETTTEDSLKVSSEAVIDNVVLTGVAQQTSPEELLRTANDAVTKVNEATEDSLTLESTEGTKRNLNAAELRYSRRNTWAEAYISERLRNNREAKSFTGKALDVLDRFFVRQLVVGTFEDITNRSGRLGEELLDASLDSTISDKQYQEFIKTKVSELEEEGFFREDNLFALAQLYEANTTKGYNESVGIDRAFGVIDVAGITKGLTVLAKTAKASKLAKATTPLQKKVSLDGPDVSGDVAAKVVDKVDDPDILDDVVPPHESYGNKSYPINSAKVNKVLEENKLAREVKSILDSGVAGRVATKQEIAAASETIITGIQRVTNRPVSTWVNLDGPLGEKIVEARLGKVGDGSAFVSKASASRAASRIENSRPVPVDPSDETKGWQVLVQRPVDLTGVSDPFEVQAVTNSRLGEIVSSFAGSTALRDLDHLNNLAQLGESASVAFKRAAGTQLDSLNKLNAVDKTTLGKVITELRDGKHSGQREFYTETQFKEEWVKNHPRGLEPTEKQFEAYTALKELSDTAWLIEASEALQTYVRNGYTSAIKVDGGYFTPALKVTDVDAVLDKLTLAQQSAVKGSKASVWKLEKPLDDGSEFVVNPKDTRLLEYEDVFGFNAGGRRGNEEANYFVMLADNLDGSKARPKAMLTAFTEKKAAKAVDQLEVLADANRKGTLSDELVQSNNSWNPDVDTVDGFLNLARTSGWDLTRKISYKARNQPLDSIDETNPFAGSTAEKFFRNDNRRADDVLLEYGGAKVRNSDAVTAITDQYQSAATQIAQRAHSLRAIDSWLKTAAKQPSIKLDQSLANSPRQQFLNARITGSSPTDLRMKELRDITKRRLAIKSDLETNLGRVGQSIVESIDDKFGKKINIPNIEGTMLNVAFKSAFGFMNFSQFVMQSAHAAAIIAISPRHGSVGAARVVPMRMLLSMSDPKAELEATKRFAKFSGMDIEDANELVTYIKTSARDVLEGDVAEAGTGVGYGVSGWRGESYLSNVADASLKTGKKAVDLGLIPFNQGERLARLTAINTAFAEFKANPAFKGVSALSDEGRAWITRREQTLGFNMTTGSRPYFQSGIAKIPTQWMSYSFRAMEAITFGTGGLTKGERVRLFAALGPMYGTTGMGLASGADYISQTFGLEPDDDMNSLIRFGLLDYVIGEVTGAETALGTRLAPLTMIPEIYKDISQGNLLEAIGGPSGQISAGIIDAVTDTTGDIIHGREVQITESIIKVLRQPASIDKFFGAYGVWNNGVYRSKNGVKYDGEMNSSDLVQLIFGFTPADMVEVRQRRSEMYMKQKTFNTYRKDMGRKADKAWDWIASQDVEERDRGAAMLKELHAEIELRPLSETMKQQLRKVVLNKQPDAIMSLVKNLQDNDRDWAAERMLKETGELR